MPVAFEGVDEVGGVFGDDQHVRLFWLLVLWLQLQLEEVAMALVILDLLDRAVLKVVCAGLGHAVWVVPERVVDEEDGHFAEDHKLLVTVQLDHRDEVRCLADQLLQGFDH